MRTIREILHTLIQAQKDYASEPRDGETTKHYASKFMSDEGKHNGLYWQTSGNDAASPIGPLLVSAASEGYQIQQGQRAPFHGYYYRMLTKQGAAAKGGARDYVSDGKLTRGFAFVAYLAEYHNSGVMNLHRQSEWSCVSEGLRPADIGRGSSDDGVRSRRHLGASRLTGKADYDTRPFLGHAVENSLRRAAATTRAPDRGSSADRIA